jgi:hypothetical protein
MHLRVNEKATKKNRYYKKGRSAKRGTAFFYVRKYISCLLQYLQ